MVDNVRLPVSVEQGAVGGPRFSTSVQVALSGVEQRQGEWDVARCEYDISYGITNQDDLDAVMAFYYAQNGPLHSFRFRDWNDYRLANELIATGDGSDTAFQIKKTYSNSARSYTRNIQLPVDGTIEVTKNGVLQIEDTDYTIDYNTGIVTFGSAPANGHTIIVSGEFDVPVRFRDDNIDFQMMTHDGEDHVVASIQTIKLIEVLDE